MSKALYPVLDGVTHKGKKMYTVLGSLTKKVKKGYSVVPEKYRYLEYIESSGTQYIDTGVVPNEKTACELEMSYTAVSANNCGLFGAAGANWQTDTFEGYFQNGVFYLNFADTSMSQTGTIAAGDRCKIRLSQQEAYWEVNGQSVMHIVPTTQSFTSPTTFVLHALNRTGNVAYHSASRCYGCKLWDNGVLIRDFVPCINSAGVVGLLDRVEKKFYTNTGTDVFTGGAETGGFYTQSYARLFYSGNPFGSYTGTYTISDITKDGVPYKLYTLTGSGTLTLNDAAQVWMCGGGGKGGNASILWSGLAGASYNNINTAYSGGGGAGGYVYSGVLSSGEHTVTIGAASGATTIATGSGNTLTAKQGGNDAAAGGTAGGRRRYYNSNSGVTTPGSNGSGVSTYPFGITSLYAHAAGGGSGGAYVVNWPATDLCGGGYAGGTNGGNSGAQASSYNTKASGGVRGGGAGGQSNYNGTGRNGSSATFYGSGGGGGALYDSNNDADDDSTTYKGSGGNGYQGVAYLLIPA